MRDIYTVHSYHETKVVDPEHPHPIIEDGALAQALVFLAEKQKNPEFVLPEDPGYQPPKVILDHIARSNRDDYEEPEMVQVIVVEMVPDDPGASTITHRIHDPSKDERKAARELFKRGSRLQLNWTSAPAE